MIREHCAADVELGDSLIQLVANLDQLSGFLEQPSFRPRIPEQLLTPGAILAERFKITTFLGRGGMGEVYRAEDLDLGIDVALKVVRGDLFADETTRSRFRGEIRLAREISHPNVCRIFDSAMARRDSQEFLACTMEFLDGETLAAQLARGPVSADQALRFAVAIAEGLTAAHQQGIVHRDLKPANIMIAKGRDGSERVVIMDFGLATRMAGKADGGGERVGSPDYMAPEQFRGTVTTPATDVYALGAIVFEMITGRKPFPAEPIMDLALRRVSENAPDLRTISPAVSKAMARSVGRALALDPQARYQSAREFVRDLEGGRSSGFTRRKFFAAVIFCVLAMTSFIAILRLIRRRSLRASKPALMLMPCSYATDDSQSRSLAQMADLLFRTQLVQSGHVALFSTEQVNRGWRLMGHSEALELNTTDTRTALQIALRSARGEQTPFVLFSNIARAGDHYSLVLSLEQPRGGPDLPLIKAWQHDAGRPSDLPDVSFDAVKWIRETVGEPQEELEARSLRPDQLTTPDWQALQEYGLAELAWKNNQADASILHLKAAVALDPDFAFAQARLGDHLLTFGNDEGYQAWAQAAKTLQKRNHTDRESLSIRGRFAQDVGLDAEAEDVFSRYALEFPNDALPLFYKASAVARQGRLEQAEQLYDLAIEKNPGSLPFLLARGALHLQTGDVDAAERDWRLASQSAHSYWLDLFEVGMAMARGQFDKAGNILSRVRANGSPEFQSRAFALQACLRAEQGAWQDAADLLKQGILFDRKTGQARDSIDQKQRLLAELAVQRNQFAEARAICLSALENVSGTRMQMRLGSVLAQAGDIAGARHCAAGDVPPWPEFQMWAKRLQAEIALAEGDARGALVVGAPAAPPAALRFWPDHAARAAIRAGDYTAAGTYLASLLKYPGIYWLDADQNMPGMLRYASLAVDQLRRWPALAKQVDLFRPLLKKR